MTIAVYARSTKDNLSKYLEEIHAYFQKENVELIVYEPFYRFLQAHTGINLEVGFFSNSEELIKKAFYLICLGGDGTMLEAVSFVRKSGIPVLGVNTGRLGFLSPVNKDDLQSALQKLLREKFTLDKRELIQFEGCNNCFKELNFALNEFTIHKKDTSSMIHIDTYVDDIFLNSYFADGLIVSTPTGSTAYSLSCGGPIMMPDSDNFIITPIAPHNLAVRPIVVSNNREVRFNVTGRSEDFKVALDSRSATVPVNTEIRIRKADFRVNLINLEGQHFFSTLRNKMMWGIDKRH